MEALASNLVNKYSAFSGPARALSASVDHQPATVLLTGATGALGTRTLSELLLHSADQVERVYCLTRGEDDAAAHTRTLEALRKRGCEHEQGLNQLAHGRLQCRAKLDDVTKSELSTAKRLVVIHVSHAWLIQSPRTAADGGPTTFAVRMGRQLRTRPIFFRERLPRSYVSCAACEIRSERNAS